MPRVGFAGVGSMVVALALGAPRCGRISTPAVPNFYRDVLPILQQHCQQCHRPGEIGPTSLVTYEQVKSAARLVRDDVRSKRMPPWFADSCFGHFSDDPSLTPEQIAIISDWVEAKAPV